MAKTIRWENGDKVENVEIRIGEAVLKVSGVVNEVIKQERERSAIHVELPKYLLKSPEEVIGRTITRISFSEGYDLGGMSLTLDNKKVLILYMYSAEQYLLWNGEKVNAEHIWKAWKGQKITGFDLSEKSFSMNIGRGNLSFNDAEKDYFKLSDSDDLRKAFVLVDIRELCNSRKPDYKG